MLPLVKNKCEKCAFLTSPIAKKRRKKKRRWCGLFLLSAGFSTGQNICVSLWLKPDLVALPWSVENNWCLWQSTAQLRATRVCRAESITAKVFLQGLASVCLHAIDTVRINVTWSCQSYKLVEALITEYFFADLSFMLTSEMLGFLCLSFLILPSSSLPLSLLCFGYIKFTCRDINTHPRKIACNKLYTKKRNSLLSFTYGTQWMTLVRNGTLKTSFLCCSSVALWSDSKAGNGVTLINTDGWSETPALQISSHSTLSSTALCKCNTHVHCSQHFFFRRHLYRITEVI